MPGVTPVYRLYVLHFAPSPNGYLDSSQTLDKYLPRQSFRAYKLKVVQLELLLEDSRNQAKVRTSDVCLSASPSVSVSVSLSLSLAKRRVFYRLCDHV